MCAVQLLTMLSLSVYAAQLTNLRDIWQLSNTDAGWIGASYFVGYTISVPILTSLTDRINPKRIYMVGAALLAAGCICFGLFANGLVSAIVFHAIAGAGLAGTYMPGLKALVDQVDDSLQSRASAFYTASFGFGAAFSYPFSAYVGAWYGWPIAFVGAGLAAVASGLLVHFFMPDGDHKSLNIADTHLLDFRPVLRNRSAMAFTFGYTVHCWELFGLRTWVVAFLLYGERLHGVAPELFSPALVAAFLTLVGVPASILGNEMAMRIGRQRAISLVMILSALVCFTTGLTIQFSYYLAVGFCIFHGITVIADSAALTAGAIGSAQPGYRGATMAVHSMFGFTGATFGPIFFGWVLDQGGGETLLGWWMAFAHMGLVLLFGPLVFWLLRPPAILGDRN
jgi:MFS family permease